MAENAPIGNNENELLMRCNIYFELLATEPDEKNKITKENAAAKLIAAIDGGDVYTIIKNKLRDCLIKLGEIYNIRENIQIKSLQQLMETNKDAINKLGLEDGTVPNIEECPADTSIEECKQKLNGYVEQLQKMGEKIKQDKAAKKQEEGNMEQHKEQVESINNILAELDLENKEKIEEVINKLNQLNLEIDDQQNVSNIIADLNKIKNGSSDADEVQQLESTLKEQQNRTGELAQQEANLNSRAEAVQQEAVEAQQKAEQYRDNMVQEIDKAESNRDRSLSDAADQEILDAVDSVTSNQEGTEESKAGETGSEEGSKESRVSPNASKPNSNQLKDDWEKYLKEHNEVKNEPKTYMTWLRTVGSATDPNSTDKIRSKDNLIKLTKEQFPDSNPEEIHKELFEQDVPPAPSSKQSKALGQVDKNERLNETLGKMQKDNTNRKEDLMARSPIGDIGKTKKDVVTNVGGRNKKSRKNRKSSKKKSKKNRK